MLGRRVVARGEGEEGWGGRGVFADYGEEAAEGKLFGGLGGLDGQHAYFEAIWGRGGEGEGPGLGGPEGGYGEGVGDGVEVYVKVGG